MSTMTQPGWLPDPSDSEKLRWWDGERFTASTVQQSWPVPDHRGLAIAAAVVGTAIFFPLALPGVVALARSRSVGKAPSLDEAVRRATSARRWALVGLVLTAILVACMAAIYVAAFMTFR